MSCNYMRTNYPSHICRLSSKHNDIQWSIEGGGGGKAPLHELANLL